MESKSVISKTVDMMLEMMEKLKSGEVDSKTAQAMACNAKVVIDAAKSETEFIRTVKAVPHGGIWGKEMTFLEPNVSDKAAMDYETGLLKARKIEMKAETAELEKQAKQDAVDATMGIYG